jgi:hypothetical protein
MEGLGVMGFVFGLLGVVAFLRLEKLTKELRAKGILDEDYREERSLFTQGIPILVPSLSIVDGQTVTLRLGGVRAVVSELASQ